MIVLQALLYALIIYILLGVLQLIYEIIIGVYSEIINSILIEEDDFSTKNKLKYHFVGILSTIIFWYEAYLSEK